jgi:hypothetical protein
MSLKAFCIVILAAAFPAAAFAVDQPEAVDRSALRVCSDPGNMPFSNQKGEGFENKIAELIAGKLGVPVPTPGSPRQPASCATPCAPGAAMSSSAWSAAPSWCSAPTPTTTRPT